MEEQMYANKKSISFYKLIISYTVCVLRSWTRAYFRAPVNYFSVTDALKILNSI